MVLLERGVSFEMVDEIARLLCLFASVPTLFPSHMVPLTCQHT